jgi:hypothetical protein
MSTTTGEPDLQQSALGPPQFTLRALLAAITLLSCLFALMSAVGTLWSLVLALFLSLVSAHVLGNSLGTRLRDRASRLSAVEGRSRPFSVGPLQPLVAAPKRLTQRGRLSRITPVTSIGAALAGATLGGVGLTAIYPQASLAAAALGIVSSAVLGAFAGFTTSSFLSVACQALGEALGDGESAVHTSAMHDAQGGPHGNDGS